MMSVMNIPDKFVCVIPVRYKSARFLGKPFALIKGKTMLQRVYENAKEATLLNRVIVAAYGDEIEDYCKENGFEYVRVSDECKNGSEAVADAAKTIDTPYIFELQGDQPLVVPSVIDDFLIRARQEIIENNDIDIVQPFSKATEEQITSEDVVKVAISKSNKMIMVTRKEIQSGYRTLGLYLWKKDVLTSFPNMEVTDYETAEQCHLVRFFLNDLYVQGLLIDGTNWVEVDREEHIAQVEALL